MSTTTDTLSLVLHEGGRSIGDALPGERLVFWRCLACLESYTVPEALGVIPHPCHDFNRTTDVERLGPAVDQTHYATKDTPCDDRCTSARGPLCECNCRGVNHGTGLTIDKYLLAPQSKRAEHTRLATLWHGPVNEAVAAGEAEFKRLRAMGWVSNDCYRARDAIHKAIGSVRKARTVKARESWVGKLTAATVAASEQFPDVESARTPRSKVS